MLVIVYPLNIFIPAFSIFSESIELGFSLISIITFTLTPLLFNEIAVVPNFYQLNGLILKKKSIRENI